MKLRILTPGNRTAREVSLRGRRVSVGSAPDNTLVIDEQTVSRHHVRLERRRGTWSIIDLGSTNGAFLDGRRIEGKRDLKSGSELRFGAVRCVVTAEDESRRPVPIRLMLFSAMGLFALGFGAVILFQNSSLLEAKKSDHAAKSALAEAPGAPMSDATPASSSEPVAINLPDPKLWLEPLNAYRSAAGVPPVESNPKLSRGDYLHSHFMVEHYADRISKGINLGAAMHTEEPSMPGYTAEGAAAAKAGDVDEMWDPTAMAKPSWAIDDWILGPFHRLSLLDPHLHSVGYGYFCAKGVCVAALNVHDDTSAMSPGATWPKPILYPPDNGVITAAPFEAEWPNPLTSCPGYKAPAGFPITMQMGEIATPALSEFTLTLEGAPPRNVEACGFDARSYANPDAATQQAARMILQDYGAVIVVPRAPLTPGKYTITMTVGEQKYSWSFTVKT